MTQKQTIRDVDVRGKRVFVRVDFNVPLDTDGRITDDSRIRGALPTIRYLLEQSAAVILASHLGRPEGKADLALSLRPAAIRLAELLNIPVTLAPDSVGPEVRDMALQLQPGQILLLENLRFHAEEEANDAGFSRELAALAELYVNDAFGTAHRAHASTVGIASYLPAVSGLLMEREIVALSRVLENPKRPLVAVIGGAKISSKIGVLQHLLGVADEFLIGGGMANTLLKAQGVEVGSSLVENDKLDTAREFLAAAEAASRPVHLPSDTLIVQRVAQNAQYKVRRVNAVPAGWAIVDIGPDTIKEFGEVIRRAGTVVWNGPMGIFEIPRFAGGTAHIATLLAASGAVSIVGGGDSVAAVDQAGLADRISHVSTGGGASLEFLEGRELPGVAVLADKQV